MVPNLNVERLSPEADAIAPLFQQAESARPRGRPPGARSQVLRDARSLGIHHFAFVRASLLGLDLAASFARYLAWSETTTDLRYVHNRRAALLKQIIEAGRLHDATLARDVKITRLLDLLRSDAVPAKTVQLPSLDEWAASEGMDLDAWMAEDLLVEYKAAFGLDNADAIEAMDAAQGLRDPAAERVKALNHLETVLSVSPVAQDRLEAWFARPVVICLRNNGLLTLGDLVRFINVYGHRWYSRIKGFGAQRARQVLTWLVLEQEHLQLSVSRAVHAPKSKQALQTAAMLPAVGQSAPALSPFGSGTLVASALARMQSSPGLAGERGDFRSHMANTLGAGNDLEAVSAWLSRYKEKPATQRSYRKEAERFLLWCARELQKPLSSVTSPDCQRYRAFLQAVPASWVQRGPLLRTDPAWRAFRTQPSAASQKQALVILQTLFGGLVDAGYLVANPMRMLMKSFNLPATKMDIGRAFSQAEWQHVLNCLEVLPVGPERLRLKCILALLVTSGIRLDELAKARHRDLRLEQLPDLPETWVLTVTGKRNKTREVPLHSEVVQLLARHSRDFVEEDSLLAPVNPMDLALIRTLHASVAQWRKVEGVGGADCTLIATAVSARAGSALSGAGIYVVLKRFFQTVAKSADGAELDARRFEKASTHWMRHTFVRQALVNGVPIEVVSELAGHASIDTTSIYSTQELRRKIEAIQLLRSPLQALSF